MEEKFSKLTDTLDKIAGSLEGQAKRITEAEQRVCVVEDQVATLELRLSQAEDKLVTMAEQMDDAENRSRRDNIQILNLKEGTEGEKPLEFFESWLPKLLGLSAAKGRIKMDRAHRTAGPRSDRPRPMIIKLHNSRDKPRILAAPRKAKNLEHGGSHIFIHQDLSSAVRLKRCSYNDVVRKLIDKDIRFMMRFPARLVIQHNGTGRPRLTDHTVGEGMDIITPQEMVVAVLDYRLFVARISPLCGICLPEDFIEAKLSSVLYYNVGFVKAVYDFISCSSVFLVYIFGGYFIIHRIVRELI